MFHLCLLLALTCGQPSLGDKRDIDALIRDLGSADFRVREAASGELKKRPDAAPTLQRALQSSDTEVRGRAAAILDFLDRAPLRRLAASLKGGRVEDAIHAAMECPSTLDTEVWEGFAALTERLADKVLPEESKSGSRRWCAPPIFVAEPRITEAFPFERQKPALPATGAEERLRLFFVRTGTVAFDTNAMRAQKARKGDFYHYQYVFVSSGSVVLASTINSVDVYCGGDFTARAALENAVIFCGRDAILTGHYRYCLIVARGNITLHQADTEGTLLIAGKSVIAKGKGSTRGAIISENDPNPLGFIRWSDPPKKDKAAARPK